MEMITTNKFEQFSYSLDLVHFLVPPKPFLKHGTIQFHIHNLN